MFYQIFFSPYIKRCGIIPYKRCMYELPHELPNGLRLLRKLGNLESLKTIYSDSLVPSLPPKMKINASKKLLENRS